MMEEKESRSVGDLVIGESVGDLTIEESVKYHRELWTWLTANPKANKSDWPGWKQFYNYPANLCFACERDGCTNTCLFIWSYGACTISDGMHDVGIYDEWRYAYGDDRGRTKLARQIANLPVNPIYLGPSEGDE